MTSLCQNTIRSHPNLFLDITRIFKERVTHVSRSLYFYQGNKPPNLKPPFTPLVKRFGFVHATRLVKKLRKPMRNSFHFPFVTSG
jgi:hypothetical protein